jgi:uncharacterized damage-inducible protein DinB
MEKKSHCTEWLAFHQWRQEQIGTLLRSVDTEYFSKQLSGSFGSLFIVLKHLIWAEKVWLGRVKPNVVAMMRDVTPSELVEEWENVTRQWVEVVQNASEADFDTVIEYSDTKGNAYSNTLFEIILHFVDHSTYHVGQMMNAIRAFGLEPVSTNYIHYLRAKNA